MCQVAGGWASGQVGMCWGSMRVREMCLLSGNT